MSIGFVRLVNNLIETYSQQESPVGKIEYLSAKNGINLTVPRGSTRLDLRELTTSG